MKDCIVIDSGSSDVYACTYNNNCLKDSNEYNF